MEEKKLVSIDESPELSPKKAAVDTFIPSEKIALPVVQNKESQEIEMVIQSQEREIWVPESPSKTEEEKKDQFSLNS